MKLLSILFPCLAAATTLQASVLIQFDNAAAYTDNFEQRSTSGTVGYNSEGYVAASGSSRTSTIYTPADNFSTETISFTFSVDAAQSGDAGLYARVRDDGGAVMGGVLFGRSGVSSNGNFVNLVLRYGGANFILGGSAGTTVYTGSTVYLYRYIDPEADLFTFTLEQRQGTTAEFRASLSLNGEELSNSDWIAMPNSGFNAEGGVGMYFRPATLDTVKAYSFEVIPEPSFALLAVAGGGVMLWWRGRNKRSA